MAKKKLKTVEEHNYERRRAYEDKMNSDIACPECGTEMKYPDHYVTMTHPPKRKVECPKCDHSLLVTQ